VKISKLTYETLILGAFMKLQSVIISFIVSVNLSESKNSVPTGQILTKIKISFFKNLSRNRKFLYNLTRIMGTLHEEMSIHDAILLVSS